MICGSISNRLWRSLGFKHSNLPIETQRGVARGKVDVRFGDRVFFGSKSVPLISDKKEVERAEVELSNQIQKGKSKVPVKRTVKKPQSKGTATERQVSRALGERTKLTDEQVEAKKKAAHERKLKEAAQRLEEERQEKALRGTVSRTLNFDKVAGKSTVSTGVLSDDEVVDDDEDDDDDDDDIDNGHGENDGQLNESVIVRTHENNESDLSDTDEDDHQKEEISDFSKYHSIFIIFQVFCCYLSMLNLVHSFFLLIFRKS